MNDAEARILIFDSGVGGLSIYQEITKQFPTSEYIYLEDSAVFPYGQLTEPKLVGRIVQVIPSLVDFYKPDVVVIACNSASTISLEPLRELVKAPIVGVVPAIKPAAESTKTGTIALLATSGTIQRSYTADLIASFAPNQEVLSFAADQLVVLAEQYLTKGEIPSRSLYEAISPLLEHPSFDQVDHVILGCTHFPLLSEALSDLLGSKITLVDSGEAIARRVDWVINHSEQVFDHAVGSRPSMTSKRVFHYTAEAMPKGLHTSLRSGQYFDQFSQWVFK